MKLTRQVGDIATESLLRSEMQLRRKKRLLMTSVFIRAQSTRQRLSAGEPAGYANFESKLLTRKTLKPAWVAAARGGRIDQGRRRSLTGVTQKRLDEGFHYYHLTIDGGVFNDPGTLNYYGGKKRWGKRHREVPAKDKDFYELKDATRWFSKFFSTLRAQSRSRAFVYTTILSIDSQSKFPVLYLQHGWGEDETAWSNHDASI
ncbi:MAG: hypothetical protein U0930_07395 [Pirellulales bacterium]